MIIIAEAAFHMATLVATKFSIVTTLPRTAKNHCLNIYCSTIGFKQHCAKIRCIDFTRIGSENDAENMLIEVCSSPFRQSKQQDDIGAIVLGCGGMAEMAEQVAQELDIPVIDGVSAAVKLLEASCKGNGPENPSSGAIMIFQMPNSRP